MKILVVGGTGLIGKYITENLLQSGHNVTIATRSSGLILDRTNEESIRSALKGKSYDVVYDTQAYSSNEIKILLDNVSCKRYIEVSTVSVYAPDFKLQQQENDFNPYEYPLKWCNRKDFAYDEIKRQAECAMFQAYSHIPSAAVRIPFVLGMDDNTRRLHFYVKHILAQMPMNINNLDAQLSFILSSEAGQFLAWLVDKELTGAVNASSIGTITLAEIIKYVENKTGKQAIISEEGENAPYNYCPSFSLATEKAGFSFSNLNDWIYGLLDELIGELSV